jgi:hypothetical protein
MLPINVYYSYECDAINPTIVWNIEFNNEIYLLNNESFGGRSADNMERIYTKNIRGSLCSEGDGYSIYNKAGIPIEFEYNGKIHRLKIDAETKNKIIAITTNIYEQYKNIENIAVENIAKGKIEILISRLSNRKYTVLNLILKEEDLLFDAGGIEFFLAEHEKLINFAIKKIFESHLSLIKDSDKFYDYIFANYSRLENAGFDFYNILLALINYTLQYDIFDNENYLIDYLGFRLKYFNDLESKLDFTYKSKIPCCISVYNKEENMYENGVKLREISISLQYLIYVFNLINNIKFLCLIDIPAPTPN